MRLVLRLRLTHSDGSCCFFFSSRRRHTRLQGDWSSDVCSSDLRTYILPSSAASLPNKISGGASFPVSFRRNFGLLRPYSAILFLSASVSFAEIVEIGRASCRERV